MSADQDTAGVRPSRAHRWLAPAALVVVALAAVMGWGASFVGLHEYGQASMSGFDWWSAWLVPATFDGAAFACTLVTYRASISGRSSMRGRLLMWAFTAVSAWINWIHQHSPDARIVAAGLPVAAVAVFDIVLIELRADYEARHGRTNFRLRPGLLILRWLTDRAGTAAAFRAQITSIPVEQLAGLAAPTAAEPRQALEPESELEPTAQAEVPEPAPEPVRAEPQPANARQVPKAVSRGPKLPTDMLDKVRAARDRLASEGREMTAADVQQTIRVPGPMAAQVAAEFATTNGHPVP